ncbi:MAG TPA: RbsD/FucU domain-containing protein [Chthoniobacterales bacterium]
MLKNIPSVISPDLLWLLASMGHGDDLVLVDRNFPAVQVAKRTSTGRLIELPGLNIPQATRAILSLMPLDDFVEEPVVRMRIVDEPDRILEIQNEVIEVAREMEGREVKMGALERFAFYEAAGKGAAVVRTSEFRPYGCFLFKMGVIFDR